MNISLILAHPDPSSFNHAIALTAVDQLVVNRHYVAFHDLYAENFDPVLTAQEIQTEHSLIPEISNYCDELINADGIIIVHPNWWGQPPAILKGWIDRVFRRGIAYKFHQGDQGEGIPVGLLNVHTALVFNTANTPPEREKAIFGDPLQLLWKNCIFDLCGVETFHREVFTTVVTSTQEERAGWLKKVEQIVDEYFPIRESSEEVPRMGE